jgi:two-component system, cell cycle sensor histidine kinase and response regulator CckA
MNKAHSPLIDSEMRYRRLFETAQDSILILDGDTGKIIDANPFISNMLGYAPGELLGKSLWDIGELKDILASKLSYEELQKHNYVRYDHLPLVTKDGRNIAVEVVANAYMVDSKRVIQCNIRDITERNLLAEAQQMAAKMEAIGTLAGGIAHDFNNILTGILGNIGLAKRKVKENGETWERLEEAEKAIVKAKDLSQQLLTFSKGGIPNKKVISIGRLLHDSATFVLRGSKVRPEFDIPDDLWAIEADESQMHQVISNIVINADQAMPHGKTLNIEAKNIVVGTQKLLPLPAGNYVEISIKDSGIGIPEEYLNRIFDPFFTTKQKGSGLGLSSAYSIVKNHGGWITVTSKLGIGSTFNVYVPATDKQLVEEAPLAAGPVLRGTGKILVMDDDDTIRHMLNTMLTLGGYSVELTKDGHEAIAQYTKAMEAGKPFDAVIMDLTVPGGMGGKDSIAKLLEMDPAAKVIVSSGYSTDPVMNDFKKFGFSAAVTKPYTIGELEKTLHHILKKK